MSGLQHAAGGGVPGRLARGGRLAFERLDAMLRGGYYRGTTVLSSGGANRSASAGWRSQIAALTGELAESEDEIERFQAEQDLRGMQSAAAREQIARLRWADQTAAEGPSQGTAENGKKPGDRDEGR